MAGPAGPIKQFHPAAAFTPGGVQTIPLTLGSDADLTLTAGQTGGYMARAIQNGGTPGNLGFYDGTGAGPFVQGLAAYQLFEQSVSYVVNSTTACNPSAVL
jgi:hypothetical protein